MINKTIFQGMGSWSRLFFFLFFLLLGIIIALFIVSLITIPFASEVGTGGLSQNIPFLKITQVVQSIGLFIVPVILYTYFFEENYQSFLKTKFNSSYSELLIIVILTIAIQPIIQLVAYYNNLMNLPESMGAIEKWMRASEDSVKKIIELFIADKSIGSYASNILIIAVLAGISEELFFRAGLQQIINRIVRNKNIAVWITAIIFSAIHFQFYGFIPRLLLGALLGYLFIWSKNIWIPILVHILHNAINIIIPQIYFGSPKYEMMETMGIENHMWLAAISLIISVILITTYKKKTENKTLSI
ncbi:MAG: CPBP family intramembrane metalloprotease [Dysgonomonas sp.]